MTTDEHRTERIAEVAMACLPRRPVAANEPDLVLTVMVNRNQPSFMAAMVRDVLDLVASTPIATYVDVPIPMGHTAVRRHSNHGALVAILVDADVVQIRIGIRAKL